MKQFFGAFFGSIIGLVIATLLVVLIIVGAVKTSISSAMKPEETIAVKPNSVLQLVMNGNINDRDIENPFEGLEEMGYLNKVKSIGLNVLIKKLKYAQTDDKIKGIYLKLKNIDGGYSNITELRNSLIDFKKSGKFIYCYGENFTQKEYYLASAASKIFLNPQGMMEFKGLSMSLLFYKNAFEKLGVDVQIFRHGKFKSAIEPLVHEKMSIANRLQSETFLHSIWLTMLQGISAERNLSIAELNKMADNLDIQSPENAAQFKLVDKVAYEDEVITIIKKKLGLEEKDKNVFVEMRKYHNQPKLKAKVNKNKIAVIYANGAIYGGEGNDEEIGSDRIVRTIKEARLDENVKAIVFRVNSPGGSSLASDVIWREVTLAKKAKPFIVSMGNYAASGGYYISCAAHRIFAQPNTITGSIGVFGFIPNIQKALEEKLGITIDTVNTNQYSNMGTALMPVTEKERQFVQNSVEKVYDTFISKVAEGRNMPKNLVDSIGQGRVWTGKDAIVLNLVDELGGLNDAINYAAKAAKLDDYKLVELPKLKNPLEIFLGKAEDEAETRILKKNLGATYTYLKHFQNIISAKGIQTRLPFDMVMD